MIIAGHTVRRVAGADVESVQALFALDPHYWEHVEGAPLRENEAAIALEERPPSVPIENKHAFLVDDAGEVLFEQVHRSRVDVDDLEPGLDLHPVGQAISPTSDEHPHVHAGLGERGGELPHVDVHAAGIAGARLDVWRGVQGDDGDGAHGMFNSLGSGPFPTAGRRW